MEQRRWAVIPDFPNYAVSDDGLVKRLTTRCSGKAGAILKAKPANTGYPMVNLLNAGGRKRVSVHRLVALAFVVRPEGAAEVNHIDANRAHNHWSNLEWVTPSGNRLHAYRVGALRATGEQNGYSKLTEDRVRAIRARGASNDAERKALAAEFGVHFRTIRDVVNRRTWAHV